MKQMCILTLILLTLNSYSQDCSIGNTDNTNSISSIISENLLIGFKLSLLQEGTLNSIDFIGGNTGASVQMALYSDNVGSPQNLLAESQIATVGSGLISLSVNRILLPAGEYWVMANYNSSDYNSYSTSSNTLYYFQDLDFGNPIPSTWTSSNTFTSTTLDYSLNIDCGNTLAINTFNYNDNVNLFPNPSADFISVSNLKKQENYIVVNTLGREVQKGIIADGKKIDIQNLANGLYFLNFDDGNTIKFIKN